MERRAHRRKGAVIDVSGKTDIFTLEKSGRTGRTTSKRVKLDSVEASSSSSTTRTIPTAEPTQSSMPRMGDEDWIDDFNQGLVLPDLESDLGLGCKVCETKVCISTRVC